MSKTYREFLEIEIAGIEKIIGKEAPAPFIFHKHSCRECKDRDCGSACMCECGYEDNEAYDIFWESEDAKRLERLRHILAQLDNPSLVKAQLTMQLTLDPKTSGTAISTRVQTATG